MRNRAFYGGLPRPKVPPPLSLAPPPVRPSPCWLRGQGQLRKNARVESGAVGQPDHHLQSGWGDAFPLSVARLPVAPGPTN